MQRMSGVDDHDLPGSRGRRVAVLAVVLVAWAAARWSGADEGRYRIPPNDVAKLEREALLGDAKAAYRLLGNAALSGAAGTASDARFWLTVAAENGHPVAQYNLGAMLLGHADPRDQVRAEYWLSRAARSGDASAALLLKRVRKGELRPGGAAKR